MPFMKNPLTTPTKPDEPIEPHEILDLLPASTRDVAEVIGVARALLLGMCIKNRRLYVPLKLTPNCPLVRMVGMETAEKIHAVYAGENVAIGNAARVREAHRNKGIVRLRQSGATIASIACFYEVSIPCVKKALAHAHKCKKESL